MPLPSIVRVKLSSEAAGAISMTPVVVREMPLRELIEFLLPSAGKDTARIREMLAAGNFVSGASRLRWQGWEASGTDVEQVLASFPDPDPTICFTASRCTSAVLSGPYARIELPREAASRRRFLRRTSFWDHVVSLTQASAPDYLDYSYREQADCFRIALRAEETAGLRRAARLLPYPGLARQIESATLDHLDLYVSRA